MYGHQIRRDARMDRADLWSDVRPGSLYGALHRLAAEGLIAADMESAALAAAAQGRPLAVLRAVSDTPGRPLVKAGQ